MLNRDSKNLKPGIKLLSGSDSDSTMQQRKDLFVQN